MKRSEINVIIRDAEAFFGRRNFHLPPFATWGVEDWAKMDAAAAEIVDNHLGWDITDFGRDEFKRCGLVLFTIRNGTPANVRGGRGKTYCEKIIIIEEGQRCPAHHHWVKVEDIINRGGGRMAIKLHNAMPDGAFADTDIDIGLDGVVRRFPAGETVILANGESMTLEPHHYHEIWALDGAVLIGEVSVVNDDEKDNRFHEPAGRFPRIEEDEPPYRLLVGDYDKYWRR